MYNIKKLNFYGYLILNTTITTASADPLTISLAYYMQFL